jgi:hypothetical protein
LRYAARVPIALKRSGVIVMAPSYAETKDRSTIAGDNRAERLEATDDMHDTPEEMARWNPLVAALQNCREIVEPAYRAADRTAMQFQRQHQIITVAAAIFGTVAVLFAILQLPRIISGSVVSIPVAEGITAAIAFTAVLLGIVTLRQVGWMFLRHKAERFKFLKFHFLIDPSLWGADPNKRERAVLTLKYSADKITELTNEELETWAEHGILPEEPARLAGSQADAYTLYKLVDYYLTKRCRTQLKYFKRKAQQFSSRDRYIKALPRLLFFGSIFAALLHFSLDLFDTYFQPQATAQSAEAAAQTAPTISLTVALILIAASLPVIGAGVRTFRSAYQLARNTSRYKAAFEAIKLPAERLERDAQRLYGLYAEGQTTVNADGVFRDMWRCEQILEAEHREWLRLMMEAEWFG